ncbi:MAG: pyridine nucleotide-disulfide oxidoreductase, partial [Bacteroidaceae bacterium]|nr:pyridine nucleotide-disulfide oxidoreductase [Bacteroidaceae bacterium]
MRYRILTALLLAISLSAHASSLWVEAEAFAHKGGWVVDQQFMDMMGSPYLLAHGMGVPVDDAKTTCRFPENGTYFIYVRTYNWTSPWYEGAGPGRFYLLVNGRCTTSRPLGADGDAWCWQAAGRVSVKDEAEIALHDLTGFEGRVDAIYFTTDAADLPPQDDTQLRTQRR